MYYFCLYLGHYIRQQILEISVHFLKYLIDFYCISGFYYTSVIIPNSGYYICFLPTNVIYLKVIIQ